MDPQVSVIIPNYNHGRYLKKRIESVLEQTYQDFEIILLDDHSTDSSLEVIAQYKSHPKVRKVILNKTNSGSTFKQWNKGVKEAKGKYIWIAESDDYADKRLLGTLVEQLQAYPTTGIAYCQSWIIDENDNILHSGFEWYKKNSGNAEHWQNNFFNSGIEECKNYLIVACTIFNASAVLFRKQNYEDAGPADENFKYGGDWKQWTKILLFSDLVFVAEPLNYFRMHSNTTRHNAYLEFRALKEHYQVMKLIADRVGFEKSVMGNPYLSSRWQLSSKSPLTIKSISNLLDIYKHGKDIDPLLLRRILSYVKSKILFR